MSTTQDVKEFLFNRGNMIHTGGALANMSKKDREDYVERVMRLGLTLDLNAPGDAPIGPAAEKIFGELQKMASEALPS